VVGRVRNTALLIVACAIALRLAWWLVKPLIPALMILAALGMIVSLLQKRDR